MKKIFLSLLIFIFYYNSIFAQTAPMLFAKPKFSGGFQLGYADKLGTNVYGSISNFSYEIPLTIRFALGYIITDGGNPLGARKVFINDATNGTPEESGYIWEFRLDFIYPVKLLPALRTNLVLGPRYSMFTANFKFIGGNEFFDVTANQWGLGGGLETHFGISPSMTFVVSTGFDYYFQSKLVGHDTAYSPDGININPRQGYSYKDADEAVNQPKYQFRFMGGLNFFF